MAMRIKPARLQESVTAPYICSPSVPEVLLQAGQFNRLQARHDFTGESDHVGVTGEEQDLGRAGDVGQCGEGLAGAGFVEVDEDIVDDDRQRLFLL